jgi:hypothetical protein
LTASPYRITPALIEPPRAPRAELVYRMTDRRKAQRALALVTVAATTTTGLLGAGLSPASGVALGSALVWAAWRWQRPMEGRGVVLRVCRGVLHVTGCAGRSLVRASLHDIANVTLDSRTIRKVEEGNTLIPWLRFAESRVGPELEVVRIVVEVSGLREPIRLSEAFVPHMDGVDWLGRIRRFLRTHGWVPEDERESESSA